MPTIDEVKKALRTVEDPELHKDIVSLGMVKDISVEGERVKVKVELTTPACPLKDEIKARVEKALLVLEGVKKVEIDLPAKVFQAARPLTAKAPLPGVKHIIAVFACKGGVGKTTISSNLAVSLRLKGARVGLLDADIHGPNIPLMMGIQDNPKGAPNNKLIPLESHGVQLMSLGFLTETNLPSIWRGPMVHGAVQQLLRDTLWDDLDYLIVDLPPGTGDAQLTIIQSVPLSGVVFVTTPQAVSLLDGVKGIGMFRKLKVPILGIVENMSGFVCPHCQKETDIFSKGGGEAEAEKQKIPFLGSIPLDPQVVKGGDSGKPVVIGEPESEAAQNLVKMAERVAANISISQFESSSPEGGDGNSRRDEGGDGTPPVRAGSPAGPG